jgi:hypothetical protein
VPDNALHPPPLPDLLIVMENAFIAAGETPFVALTMK